MTTARPFPFLAPLAIALSTAVARMPLMWLPRPYGDEVMYALIGHQWLQGGLPYTLIWDVKPPGLFALYALTEAIVGDPMVGPRLLPLVAVFATAIGLWRIGIAWFGDPRAALIAALLYPPFSLVVGGTRGSAELLLAPFVVFGMLFAARPGAAPAMLAGLLLGLAGMIKQVAVFEAVLGGILVLLANRPVRGPGIRVVLLYGLACLAPLAGFASYFAAAGTFPDFLQAVIISAARRIEGDGVTRAEGLLRFVPTLLPLAPLLVLCCAAVIEGRSRQDRPAPLHGGWLLGWIITASLGVLLLRTMYGNYVQTLLPPAALGAGLALASLRGRVDNLRSMAVTYVAFAALTCFPFIWVTAQAEWPTGEGANGPIAVRLAELGLVGGTADPELYVADHEPALYLLTRTRQPTRFALPQHLTCAFPLPPGVRAEDELDRIMALQPRFVVISTGRLRHVCTREDRMAVITRHLDAGYRLADRIGPLGDAVDILVRIVPPS